MKPIFLIQSFCTNFLSSFCMTSSKKISFCLSVNHNPELQCVICTGATLFALNYTFCTGVLHLNCTALSQSDSSNVYMYIISNSNWTEWSTIQGVILLVISKSDECEARGRFEITSAITPWIVLYCQVLIIHIYNKFWN